MSYNKTNFKINGQIRMPVSGLKSRKVDNLLETVGNTPLVKLNRMTDGLQTTIYVKPEFMNPGGSIKDRMAIYILNKAMAEGKIGPKTAIVEATSGNTGVAVAMFGAVHNYRVILTIPDKMSDEKINTLRSYGAEVHVCPTAVPAESPESYYSAAVRLGEETGDYFILNQYENLTNPEAHYHLTAPEIWEQTSGDIDILVGGVGTGGTMSGCSKYLKERKPKLISVAIDPIGSVFADFAASGKLIDPHPYFVEGIGEDKNCPTLQYEYIDHFIKVSDKDSFLIARELTAKEGILAGGSSGSAVWGALKYAREHDAKQTMVVILPDSGVKYLSRIYNDQWMREHGFLD
ncbi:MAG: cysteine synthase family protein [candidate division Zixibacteria bacterium]